MGYVVRLARFTSDLPGDSFTGRRDVLHQGSAEVEYRWTDAATVVAGFKRTQRPSTLAVVDFHSTIVFLGFHDRLE